jgi:integrase/recombinase XerD
MKTYLEPVDIELMEQFAICPRDRLLISLLFHLGCRVSEALSIKVTDIDFKQGTVTIPHLKRSEKFSCPRCGARLAKRHRFCPECGEEVAEATRRQQERLRIRVLPLDRDTLQMLKDHCSQNFSKSGAAKLFGINRHRAWQIIRRCAERAGLPKLINPETGKIHGISPHRLRDAFAVHAVKLNDTGDGLRLLQEHLGHQSFNTTAKYRKVSGEELKKWYQNLWQSQ